MVGNGFIPMKNERELTRLTTKQSQLYLLLAYCCTSRVVEVIEVIECNKLNDSD